MMLHRRKNNFLRTILYSFTLLISLFLMIGFAAEELAGITIITAPEVRFMMTEKSKKPILIHTLSKIEYDIQCIPDSINIPVTEVATSNKLPIDKAQRLIFYCMGEKCEYSKESALQAINRGYSNVFWFRGGIPEWYRFNYPMQINSSLSKIRTKRLSPKRVAAYQRTENPLILDVRPLFWKGTTSAIKDSVFIPLVKLHQQYAALPKNRKIIIADGHMKQSPNAARFLISKGYNILGVLKGGITRWEKEGYPTYNAEDQMPQL